MKSFSQNFISKIRILLLITLILYACNKKTDNIVNKIHNLESLKKEPKFIATSFYSGLENKENIKVLSDLLNITIDDIYNNTK